MTYTHKTSIHAYKNTYTQTCIHTYNKHTNVHIQGIEKNKNLHTKFNDQIGILYDIKYMI